MCLLFGLATAFTAFCRLKNLPKKSHHLYQNNLQKFQILHIVVSTNSFANKNCEKMQWHPRPMYVQNYADCQNIIAFSFVRAFCTMYNSIVAAIWLLHVISLFNVDNSSLCALLFTLKIPKCFRPWFGTCGTSPSTLSFFAPAYANKQACICTIFTGTMDSSSQFLRLHNIFHITNRNIIPSLQYICQQNFHKN